MILEKLAHIENDKIFFLDIARFSTGLIWLVVDPSYVDDKYGDMTCVATNPESQVAYIISAAKLEEFLKHDYLGWDWSSFVGFKGVVKLISFNIIDSGIWVVSTENAQLCDLLQKHGFVLSKRRVETYDALIDKAGP
jgi:hypothetical protein